MWKMPVGLVMDANELERQVRRQFVDHQSGTAIAGIDDNPQRT